MRPEKVEDAAQKMCKYGPSGIRLGRIDAGCGRGVYGAGQILAAEEAQR